MRKFFAVLLAASVLTPGVAWADDHNDQPEQVRDRGDDGQRAERRAERQAERAQRAERPQRVERVERVERERPEAPVAPRNVEVRRDSNDNGVRWIGRGERRERPVVEQRVVEQVPVQRVEPRGQRVVRTRPGGFTGRIIDNVQARRDDDRRDGTWRDGHGDWQSNDRNRDRSDWRNRDGRSDRRWSSHWRGDRRYDWRNHRERNRSIFRVGRYYDPYGYGYRRFSIGFSLFPSYYRSSYWLDDPWQYRLPPAYGPYRWVRYYDDALLVNIYSGEVVDAIHGFFWSNYGW